jgi:small subunit ribosomal protein S9
LEGRRRELTTGKKAKHLLISGQRKMARANATIRQGVGRIRVNGVPLEMYMPEVCRERIMTPLMIAGDLRNKVDIDIVAKGGGVMGQAEASAMALSRSLVEWTNSSELKSKIMEIDEHLIRGDARQTEPKKFGGPGARRRKQKSYR